MGAVGTADSAGRARRATAQDRMRAAINAILYLLRTGCPWRYLPRDGFPPRSTVYNIFRKFQREGAWEAAWVELHMAPRERMGRQASPSAAVLDSQSVKPAEKGRQRRCGGLRRRQEGEGSQDPCPGRHRRAADAGRCPLRRHSGPRRAELVLDKIHRRFPWLELIWADGGYNAWQVEAAVAKMPVLRMGIVKRSDDMRGFVVLPRRWVVERTFSWFGRNRRLAKDFENLAETLATFVTIASIQLAVRRLARARP